MLARSSKTVHYTPGRRSIILAYGAVMAASAGFTLMTLVDAGVTTVPPWSVQDVGAVFAGGIAAGLALFFGRHWMGGAGGLGLARATVGVVIVTMAAALAAGTLVSPVYGTLAGPFMLISAFIANPVLGLAWGVVHFGAHFLFAVRRQEQYMELNGSSARAVTKLSAISQANLYGR